MRLSLQRSLEKSLRKLKIQKTKQKKSLFAIIKATKLLGWKLTESINHMKLTQQIILSDCQFSRESIPVSPFVNGGYGKGRYAHTNAGDLTPHFVGSTADFLTLQTLFFTSTAITKTIFIELYDLSETIQNTI